MLSLFPIFLDWNWYVAFFFRLFIGYFFLTTGLSLLKNSSGASNQSVGVFFSLVGSLFIVGLYVQLCGVLGFISSIGLFIVKRKIPSFLKETGTFFLLLALVSLSLLFLGAGPYAIDLPL